MDLNAGVPEDTSAVSKKKKQRRIRQKLLIIDVFLDFAKNTTLHCLRYITEVGLSVIEKIFWIITFLVSLGLCLWLITQVWHKWRYSPVIVSFNERMIPVDEVPFPSVTVCPQWKCKLNEYQYEQQYKKFFSSNGTTEVNDEHEQEKRKLEDATIICDVKNKYLLDRNISDESLVENIMKISPRIDDVFFKCSWRSKWTHCGDLFHEVLTREGVCFTSNSLSYEEMFRNESLQKEYQYLTTTKKATNWDFNSGYSSQKESVYPLRGQENGAFPDLDFILKDDPENDDIKCNSFFNGFKRQGQLESDSLLTGFLLKMYVQHPADMPQFSLYYYAAIPGQLTSLALKFSILDTSESLLSYGTEQRQCYFTSDHQLDYFKIYTPSNCHLECLSKYTYKRCGCVWFHMPHPNSSELCTLKNRRCATNAKNELASKTLMYDMGEACNCLPSCSSVQYDAEILKTSFDYKKYYETKSKEEFTDQNTLERFNFSKVEMYFKEPRFVSMRRSELFGLTDFLANCGGLLGLFLGFSVLSLIEIFYFCTLRLWCTLKKDMMKEKKRFEETAYQKSLHI